MIRKFAVLLVLLISGCSTISGSSILELNYKDFGPQVVANEILGMEWWQWEPHGDSKPKEYDIKVVVYRDLMLREVKDKYPVLEGLEKDYRYVEYDVALTYLNKIIAGNVIEEVTSRLERTRSLVVDKFGD